MTTEPKEESKLKRLEPFAEREIMRCMRCGFCRPLCPTWGFSEWDTGSPRGRMMLVRGMLQGDLEPSEYIADRLYLCTTCGYCEWRCPAGTKTVDIIEAARADLADLGLGRKSHHYIEERIREENNPLGEAKEERTSWASKELPQKGDLMYFVGCMASYREQGTAKATLNLIETVNPEGGYSVIGDELCCGSVLLRTGHREVAKALAEKNAELIKKSGAKIITTSCAGCYRTIRKDYELLGIDLNGVEILHFPELLNRWIDEGKLKPKNGEKIVVTYHDPCHLGRHMKVYDEPREVLKKLGVEVREIPLRNRETSACCGAGGGVRAEYKDSALEAATERLKQAEETGAKILVTPCPFCTFNLREAAAKNNIDMKVYDLVELVAKICT